MNCNYFHGKCLFLNGKEEGCIACPIKRAYNKGVIDTKKDYDKKMSTCKFRSPMNCYFCAFHSDCDEHWDEKDANDRQVTGKLNSEIENSKSEIVPDYRDGWRLREGDEK